MKKYLIEYSLDGEYRFNSGSKARTDIVNILQNKEFKTIIVKNDKLKIKKAMHIFTVKKYLNEIENHSIVCMQLPT